MEKERVWIFAIVIAFTIGACVMIKYYQSRGISITQKHEENKQEVEATEEEDNLISEDCKRYFENAEYVTIEKVERTVTVDEEGNSTTSYGSYYISDVDLKNQTDQTEDYTKALAEEEFDESLIASIEFQNAFDVQYQNADGWTLYKSFLMENGINGDLNQVSFDDEQNQLTGQNIYVFEQPCSIVERMLQDEVCDEILDQKVFYQTINSDDGITVPDYFSAVVQYMSGNKRITKSMYLQVTVNNWKEESHEAN